MPSWPASGWSWCCNPVLTPLHYSFSLPEAPLRGGAAAQALAPFAQQPSGCLAEPWAAACSPGAARGAPALLRVLGAAPQELRGTWLQHLLVFSSWVSEQQPRSLRVQMLAAASRPCGWLGADSTRNPRRLWLLRAPRDPWGGSTVVIFHSFGAELVVATSSWERR